MADETQGLSLLDRARISAERQRQREEDARGAVKRFEEIRTAEAKAAETRRGHLLDTGAGALRAAPAAFEETFDLLAEVDEWALNRFGSLDLNPFDNTGQGIYRSPAELQEAGANQSEFRVPERGWREIKNLLPEPERFSGQMTESIGKFLVGFATGKKALQAAGWVAGAGRASKLAHAAAAGGVADLTVFDGHEERLSNLIESNPSLSNPITEYLAADETDSELEGRLKSVLEGAGLGMAIDGLMAGFRAIRAGRRAKAAADAERAADEVEIELPGQLADEAVDEGDVLFHGTPEQFDEFDINKANPNDPDDVVNGIWFTSQSEEALQAGQFPWGRPNAPDARLIEANVKLDKPATRADVTAASKEAQKRLDEGADGKTLQVLTREILQEQGFDGFIRRDVKVDADALRRDGEVTLSDGRKLVDEGDQGVGMYDDRVGGHVTSYLDIDDAVKSLTQKEVVVFDTKKIKQRKAPKAEPEATPKADAEAAPADKLEPLREKITLTPEQVVAFRTAVENGDEAGATAALKDFNESTFDWSTIESAEDIKRIFSTTEQVFSETIDNVKGGVQTNARTKILSNLVGANADEVSRLFRDVRGDKGIAARFYAAQRINLASAQELIRLGNLAKETGAKADEAAFIRQMQVHAALQAEVKGAQTEIARALQAMSIIKADAVENFRELEELKRSFAGGDVENYIKNILGAKSLNDLNARVRMTKWERAKNIFIEYTINSMLSSVKTHAINFTSNLLNTFVYSGDRALGGLWLRMTQGDKAALREARVDITRKFSSLDEAWKLAKQAWKDGAPVSDKRQRIEFQTRRAIAMEGDGWLAKTVNVLGDVVRIPGRALITGDEFFKAINRNAEMSVLAFRQADDEAIRKGLQYGTDAYEKAVEKRMKALLDPDNKKTAKDRRLIEAQAVQKSRMVTFQESPKTKFGGTTERWINSNSFVKLVIAPFFRTPMNILRQGVFDRTPLGLLMRETRDVLKNGHPRERAEVMARMTTGVAAMSAFYAFIGDNEKGNFEVVGKIPWDSSKKASGVMDYSIRIGDKWYQFNRLEPLGMWLGMMADLKTHAGSTNEEGVTATSQAALFAFMTNVTNKTWMKSLSDLQDLFEQGTTGKTATAERAFAKFAAGEFGKLVPQLFKSTGRALEGALTGEDPIAREAWSVVDGISAQLPVLNKDLPVRHDVLGRPIRYEGGWKEIANPFAQSGRGPDVVNDELWKLNFTMRPMNKSIGAGKLELNAAEYSELTGLVSETGLNDILKTMFEGDGWDNLRDGQKIALIKQQVTGARQRARVIFLSREGRLKRFTQAQVNAKLFIEGEQE